MGSLLFAPISAVAVGGAVEIAPRTRRGTTVATGFAAQLSPQVPTVTGPDFGDIVAGDIVYYDIAAVAPSLATKYTVVSTVGENLTLSWSDAPASRTVVAGKIFSPGNHSLGVLKVLGYQVSTTLDTGTVAFASGVTALTGAKTLLAGRPDSVSVGTVPVCTSLPNQMLYVLTTTAGTLSGFAVTSS
jgi:hypothetical protein